MFIKHIFDLGLVQDTRDIKMNKVCTPPHRPADIDN